MMPNKILTNSNKQKHETTKMANNRATVASHNDNNGQQQQQQQQQQQKQDNILNVAEMLLHGVKDDEILDIWLKSISCPEFVVNFIDAGYDMPTISRITPQDLTAIGITDPTKRLKILNEIKKLNLQDGIPSFKPANLSHWLSLIRLGDSYYKSLCDQQVDTIEKVCQLTWEDFEELGISKLGHQKRLQLAIERMKELDSAENKTSKLMSEPIYDTNPSQILLVASAENHSMNGPIIAKQSSTSELSSTGSGSMHSVYSANSSHYQPTYASIHPSQRSLDQVNGNGHPVNHQQIQQQQQPIYSQPPSQISANQQQIQQPTTSPAVITSMLSSPSHRQSLSHYQAMQPHVMSSASCQQQFQHNNNMMNNDNQSLGGNRNTMVPQPHRQSLGQLPFAALANLPKHQQQLLQQSSIYATLSRQPQRAKQPPPPVPIRTNSLKSNSLIDEPATISTTNKQQHQQQQANNQYQQQQQLNNFHTISSSSLFRSGTRVSTRNNSNNNILQQFSSQTMLSKNKSFSGNAHMEALKARFLNRNSQHQFANLPQQIQTIIDHNNTVTNHNQEQQQAGLMYGMQANYGVPNGGGGGNFANGHFATPKSERGDTNILNSQRQSILSTIATPTHPNLFGQQHSVLDLQQAPSLQAQFAVPKSQQPTISGLGMNRSTVLGHSRDDYDLHSDTNSTKSLIIGGSGGFGGSGGGGGAGISVSSAINSPVDSGNQRRLNDSSSQDSGSSQTLYNSASSGSSSNEQNLNNLHGSTGNNGNFSPSSRPGDMISRHSTTSTSTLNDVNLALDQTTGATASMNYQQLPYHQRPNNLAATNSFSIAPTSSSSSSASSSSSSSTSSSSTSAVIRNSPSSSSTLSNVGGGGCPTSTTTAMANQHRKPGGDSCNATTGKDDDFPPPPSPLSLADSDEPDLVSLNSDTNFTDISHGLMTFRVGT